MSPAGYPFGGEPSRGRTRGDGERELPGLVEGKTGRRPLRIDWWHAIAPAFLLGSIVFLIWVIFFR